MSGKLVGLLCGLAAVGFAAESSAGRDEIAPAATITANDAVAAEGSSNHGQFTVTLSAACSMDTQINYSIGGSATNAEDYMELTGTVTILAGTTTATIDVNVLEDSISEGNESVTVTIDSIINSDANVTISTSEGENTATLTIIGEASFDGEESIISGSFLKPINVYAADFDGDGHMDVVSSSRDTDTQIAWFKNNGSGSFSEQVIKASDTPYVKASVYVVDLDDDGDMDVVSALSEDETIAWYENDGSGSFSEQVIATNVRSNTVYADDLDGDGDMDVLCWSDFDEEIQWYENDGSESFTSEEIKNNAINSVSSIHSADFDGDGDMDVVSATSKDNTIAWYENNGGGNFSTQTVINSSAIGAQSVYSADLDGDGDMDVVSASRDDSTIAWYENDGDGNFGKHNITTTANEPYAIYAVDIDGDGDLDVLATDFNDNSIEWYENDQIG